MEDIEGRIASFFVHLDQQDYIKVYKLKRSSYDEYEEVSSLVTLEVSRTKGKPRFENVSQELLYIYADINEDGIVERIPLFDDSLEDYFWSYDNNGLKVLQLRFYEVPTTLASPEDLGLNPT